MALLSYHKPFVTIPSQVSLLQSRGMAITDAARAEAYLERVGYYRLSGYWHPFRKSRLSNGTRIVEDQFTVGTAFSDIVALYVFDKKLRLLFLDAIERIEVGLRVGIALQLGQRDAWAHRKTSEIDAKFLQQHYSGQCSKHQHWLVRVDDLAARSHEDFAKHFMANYSDPLPLWMSIELWDFGLMSTFLAGMKYVDQEALAKKYGVPRPDLLESWTRSINHVRNICAHHSRLWNRSPADQPRIPRTGEIPDLDHLRASNQQQTRLYAVAAVIQYLLRTINPGSSWGARVAQLIETFPVLPTGMGIERAGFPKQWQQLPLWAPPVPTSQSAAP